VPYLLQLCEDNKIPATYFEITTALAFLTYKQSACDAVVLEVGLGGLYDATNVIRQPALSIITSIQLDHTKYLGDTIEEIAANKAGIFKKGCEVLAGPHSPLPLLQELAGLRGSPIFSVPQVLGEVNKDKKEKKEEKEGDRGGWDVDEVNQDIALAAITMLAKHRMLASALNPFLRSPLLRASLMKRPPCRFEVFTRSEPAKSGSVRIDVVLDIAHNPDALAALARKVKHLYPGIPTRVVVALSADKDLPRCLPPLLLLAHHHHIHTTQALNPRALPSEALREAFLALSAGDVSNMPPGESIGQALSSALQSLVIEVDDRQVGGVVVVCGSAFVMAEARAMLGCRDDRDEMDPDTARDMQVMTLMIMMLMIKKDVAREWWWMRNVWQGMR